MLLREKKQLKKAKQKKNNLCVIECVKVFLKAKIDASLW